MNDDFSDYEPADDDAETFELNALNRDDEGNELADDDTDEDDGPDDADPVGGAL